MSTEPPAPCAFLRHVAKCARFSRDPAPRAEGISSPGAALHQGTSRGSLGGCRQQGGAAEREEVVISAGVKQGFGA